MMKQGLLRVCIIVFMYSCGEKQKGTILATAKMQAVMWDMFLADAYTDKYLKKDSSKNEWVQNAALQQKIFELHKISREDFYKSYEYYCDRPETMRIILDSVNIKAERERSGLMTERYNSSTGNLVRPMPRKDSIIRKRNDRSDKE